MPDLEQNPQNEFMKEKIKERPVNKKKLIRRTIITAAMAVIFGLIACLTFLILEPVFSNWLYPEEDPQIVVFPEDQEEMSPEEMLSNNMQAENEEESTAESVELEEELIQQILAEVILTKENYKQIYTSLSNFVGELNQYMVTVTGVTSDLDWFNNVLESKGQASGVIIANNGRELLVLADYGPVEQAEKLTLTLYNGIQVEASIKQKDPYTNLAVIAANLADLPPKITDEDIKIPTLGTSNIKNIAGMPVIALGSPMGTSGSVGYGIITAAAGQVEVPDANYRLLVTDIYGSQNAGGVLFNLQGQVIGIITPGKNSADMKNMVCAYGISELKTIIAKMSNGSPAAYMGIIGVDVSNTAHEDWLVPYGAYVKEAAMDSPAMLAGIQQGDVIVAMDGRTIMNFSEYTTFLLQMGVGQSVDITVKRQVQDEYKEMNISLVLGEVN